ncbi:MAG: hypothetical protein QXZ43_03015 [Candidatus Aenigmatarchaeota archaeon]
MQDDKYFISLEEFLRYSLDKYLNSKQNISELYTEISRRKNEAQKNLDHFLENPEDELKRIIRRIKLNGLYIDEKSPKIVNDSSFLYFTTATAIFTAVLVNEPVVVFSSLLPILSSWLTNKYNRDKNTFVFSFWPHDVLCCYVYYLILKGINKEFGIDPFNYPAAFSLLYSIFVVEGYEIDNRLRIHSIPSFQRFLLGRNIPWTLGYYIQKALKDVNIEQPLQKIYSRVFLSDYQKDIFSKL